MTAKDLFMSQGYGRTSLRAVARAADVDPALISYHFGSKQGLFAAAMALTAGPSAVLDAALQGDPVTAPERVLTAIMEVWEHPETGDPLRAMAAAAMRDEATMQALREYIAAGIGSRIVEFLGGPDARREAAAFQAVIVGLVLGRYIVRVEPLASMTPREVVAQLAPTVQTAMGGRARLARIAERRRGTV